MLAKLASNPEVLQALQNPEIMKKVQQIIKGTLYILCLHLYLFSIQLDCSIHIHSLIHIHIYPSIYPPYIDPVGGMSAIQNDPQMMQIMSKIFAVFQQQ